MATNQRGGAGALVSGVFITTRHRLRYVAVVFLGLMIEN